VRRYTDVQLMRIGAITLVAIGLTHLQKRETRALLFEYRPAFQAAFRGGRRLC